MNEVEITLEQLLESRENRWLQQMSYIKDYPKLTLVCLTVIMPGSVKRNSQSLRIAKVAVEALKSHFDATVSHFEELDLPTGFEAYLLTSMSLTEAKKTACHIEDQHPLGRLFDIDVIDKTGNPLPRTAIGKLPRRCMLCDNEARHCMRNNSHSYEDLQLHIKKLVDNYV